MSLFFYKEDYDKRLNEIEETEKHLNKNIKNYLENTVEDFRTHCECSFYKRNNKKLDEGLIISEIDISGPKIFNQIGEWGIKISCQGFLEDSDETFFESTILSVFKLSQKITENYNPRNINFFVLNQEGRIILKSLFLQLDYGQKIKYHERKNFLIQDKVYKFGTRLSSVPLFIFVEDVNTGFQPVKLLSFFMLTFIISLLSLVPFYLIEMQKSNERYKLNKKFYSQLEKKYNTYTNEYSYVLIQKAQESEFDGVFVEKELQKLIDNIYTGFFSIQKKEKTTLRVSKILKEILEIREFQSPYKNNHILIQLIDKKKLFLFWDDFEFRYLLLSLLSLFDLHFLSGKGFKVTITSDLENIVIEIRDSDPFLTIEDRANLYQSLFKKPYFPVLDRVYSSLDIIIRLVKENGGNFSITESEAGGNLCTVILPKKNLQNQTKPSENIVSLFKDSQIS